MLSADFVLQRDILQLMHLQSKHDEELTFCVKMLLVLQYVYASLCLPWVL